MLKQCILPCRHAGQAFSPTHKAIIWPKKGEAGNAAATVNVQACHLCPHLFPLFPSCMDKAYTGRHFVPQMEEGPTHKGTLLSEAR
jgi:hypothetical protein